MKAADVMVSNVITVAVDASIGEVAAILLNNHISGAPVVGNNGELVGIVSEGDLIRRPEIGTAKRHSWWLELISNKWASATEYIKSHSRKVADVSDSRRHHCETGYPAGRYRRDAGAQPNQARTHCRGSSSVLSVEQIFCRR
jgi:CBS-domain-containing membrane protein